MIFMILAASDALDGTYAPYRPPYFQSWARGVWARGSWGQNEEFLPSGPPPSTGVADFFFRRRRRGWEPRV